MQINAHSKLGNIESKYAQLYNYLRSARDKARYLNIPLEASAEECLRHYQTASEMIREIEATSPAPKVSVEDFDKV